MRRLLFTTLLFLLGNISAAYAQESAPLPACANNPERCAEIRAKLQAQCAADPNACAEKKAKLKERAAEFKSKCEADPVACEEKKTKLRARLQQRSAQ